MRFNEINDLNKKYDDLSTNINSLKNSKSTCNNNDTDIFSEDKDECSYIRDKKKSLLNVFSEREVNNLLNEYIKIKKINCKI